MESEDAIDLFGEGEPQDHRDGEPPPLREVKSAIPDRCIGGSPASRKGPSSFDGERSDDLHPRTWTYGGGHLQ